MLRLGQGGEAFLEEVGEFLSGLQAGRHFKGGARRYRDRHKTSNGIASQSGNFQGERRRNLRRRDAGGDVGVGGKRDGRVARGGCGGNGSLPFDATGRARGGFLCAGDQKL